VHSTAKYCAPVWCRSAHTRLIDPVINDALRIVTGCLRPTPADNLPILADNLLSFVAMEPHCLQHAVRWSLNTCSIQRSPVHRVQMHDPSNRDTHLYPPHNNSSVYLTTITYMRRSGRITSGMRSGRTTLQDCALSSRHRHQPHPIALRRTA